MKDTGIRYLTDKNGHPTDLVINLKKFGNNELIEDFLDSLEIDLILQEPRITWEEAKTILDKQ